MRVLVDTPVWSLALRRLNRPANETASHECPASAGTRRTNSRVAQNRIRTPAEKIAGLSFNCSGDAELVEFGL